MNFANSKGDLSLNMKKENFNMNKMRLAIACILQYSNVLESLRHKKNYSGQEFLLYYNEKNIIFMDKKKNEDGDFNTLVFTNDRSFADTYHEPKNSKKEEFEKSVSSYVGKEFFTEEDFTRIHCNILTFVEIIFKNFYHDYDVIYMINRLLKTFPKVKEECYKMNMEYMDVLRVMKLKKDTNARFIEFLQNYHRLTEGSESYEKNVLQLHCPSYSKKIAYLGIVSEKTINGVKTMKGIRIYHDTEKNVIEISRATRVVVTGNKYVSFSLDCFEKFDALSQIFQSYTPKMYSLFEELYRKATASCIKLLPTLKESLYEKKLVADNSHEEVTRQIEPAENTESSLKEKIRQDNAFSQNPDSENLLDFCSVQNVQIHRVGVKNTITVSFRDGTQYSMKYDKNTFVNVTILYLIIKKLSNDDLMEFGNIIRILNRIDEQIIKTGGTPK